MKSSEIVLDNEPYNMKVVPQETGSIQVPLVGQELKYFMSELKYNGSNILKLLKNISFDPKVYGLLNEYIQEFSSQTCQVAVIGQMKAGKSSFINAFTRRTDLLPSDVNPWTTVITRLHFTGSDFCEESAEFNFFNEEDWTRLAEGGGKLRELVDRFLPGFESSQLGNHFSEMRERAAQRHGDNFHNLLGHTHTYNSVTPDVIRQYVCAGEHWNEVSEEARIGRYSDITETANIYLKSFPFAYPTTLIDTPGTNDPFFVRDEITCQNLDSADMFIVVLHAQQALTMTDLGLLRILQGLHKDRVVIFINRIDQLNDPARDSEEIKRHVEMILRNEFPSVNFPIICGSAKWGLEAVSAGDTEKFNASGIGLAARNISRLMLKGKGRNSVSKIITNLSLAVDAVTAVAVNKTKKNEASNASLSSEELNTEMQDINSKILKLKDMTSKASYYAMLFDKQLEDLVQAILNEFRAKLSNIILEHVDKEVSDLLRTMEEGKGEKVWYCDTMKIRRALEDEFLNVCRDAANRVNSSQEIVAKALRELVQEAVPAVDTSFIQFYDVQEGEPYLSTLALNHTLAMDLDNSWWKQWWSRKRKKDEWKVELTALIKGDFFPMAERLVQSAKSELSDSIKDSMNNFSAMNSAVINILNQEMQHLNSRAQTIMQNNNHNNSVTENNQSVTARAEIVEAEKITQNLQRLQMEIQKI